MSQITELLKRTGGRRGRTGWADLASWGPEGSKEAETAEAGCGWAGGDASRSRIGGRCFRWGERCALWANQISELVGFWIQRSRHRMPKHDKARKNSILILYVI